MDLRVFGRAIRWDDGFLAMLRLVLLVFIRVAISFETRFGFVVAAATATTTTKIIITFGFTRDKAKSRARHVEWVTNTRTYRVGRDNLERVNAKQIKITPLTPYSLAHTHALTLVSS